MILSLATFTVIHTAISVVQAFQKVPARKSIAPTGTELPFAAAQIVALVLFMPLGIAAVRSTSRLRHA